MFVIHCWPSVEQLTKSSWPWPVTSNGSPFLGLLGKKTVKGMEMLWTGFRADFLWELFCQVLHKYFSPFSFVSWFWTGILTSKKAEELLNKTVPGSFLIRVSEKIKGYVLSYRAVEGCKHFLIDASSDSYSFLGVDQLQHSTLADLVDYHKVII